MIRFELIKVSNQVIVLIEVPIPSQEGERSCVMDSDFAFESMFSRLDCGTVPTMFYHVSAKDRQYNDITNKYNDITNKYKEKQ